MAVLVNGITTFKIWDNEPHYKDARLSKNENEDVKYLPSTYFHKIGWIPDARIVKDNKVTAKDP